MPIGGSTAVAAKAKSSHPTHSLPCLISKTGSPSTRGIICMIRHPTHLCRNLQNLARGLAGETFRIVDMHEDDVICAVGNTTCTPQDCYPICPSMQRFEAIVNFSARAGSSNSTWCPLLPDSSHSLTYCHTICHPRGPPYVYDAQLSKNM